MSDSSAISKSCTKCGAVLPSEATEGLCPKCLMNEAMEPTLISDAAKPRRSAILTPEELAPFFPAYEIMRMLGRGGMGAVYLARQISLNRLVAIKLLPAEMNEGEINFAERFKNEAQAMAQLNHPGIVAVYDFGQTANGLLYIVMEYIEGTDVQLMLASQGRLHSAHAMAITAHVCDALQYAHTRGIIHRDIKPSNIMVSNDGVVKVADFGLAKMSHGQTTGLTQSGMAMGTLHFMAPEALMLGTAVDQRADIYAVGVMLYQMLTGRLPQGMFEMPSFQVPGLDPRYDRIVARALRDDREMRYQAALDLRHDLDAILTQPVEKVTPEAVEEVKALPPVEERGKKKARVPSLPPTQAPAAASARKKPVGLILAGFGVVAELLAAFVYIRDHRTGSTTNQPERATKEQPFVNSLGMKFVPVAITGGKQVLFCAHETRNADYAAFFVENPSLDDRWKHPKAKEIPMNTGGDYPVVMVSWSAANDFCRWLSKKEGRTYRLPTDHEWSCAIGIGAMEDPNASAASNRNKSPGIYVWGAQWPPPAGVGNLPDTTWEETFHQGTAIPGYTDGYASTAPVMSFKPNALGIYDLTGNVQEWCSDWLDAQPSRRMARGGGWNNARPAGDLQAGSRQPIDSPEGGLINLGFRCVLEVESKAIVTNETGKITTATDSTSSNAVVLSAASKDAPFINTLGMKFVPVPIGGGPSAGQRVLFGVWDVRVQDYAVYAAANPQADGSWKTQNKDGVPVGREPDHPVTAVSWEDAKGFCQWLTGKEHAEGRLPAEIAYRLPTDEEWSIAAGMPPEPGATPADKDSKNTVDFPWGKDYSPKQKVGNYADSAYHERFLQVGLEGYMDGYPTTSPVGSFPTNAHGICDMGGNVWQWCEDWFDASKKERVLRGASWDMHFRNILLSSNRRHLPPADRRYGNQGFRCVLESSVQIGSSSPSLPDSPSSATATKAAPFTNTLGMKFVPVPETKVLFSIWDTRVGDYAAYARVNRVDDAWTKQEKDGVPVSREPEYPVVGVSWEDAQAFCRWLTQTETAEGRLSKGAKYRLPTDEEWSRAVGLPAEEGATIAERSGRNGVDFPWGMDFPPRQISGNYGDETFHEKFPNAAEKSLQGYTDGFVTTSPVGSFPANAFGLHDMGGNVWQWCEDWFEASQKSRVARGSAWHLSHRAGMVSSERHHSPPVTRNVHHGFRCVLEAEPAGAASASKDSVVPSSTPAAATKDQPFVNTLDMRFVPVPGTKVIFSIWETRVRDYAAYARVNKVDDAWTKQQKDGAPVSREPDCPVVGVSWFDAQAYCQWLTVKDTAEGRLSHGAKYRLPTDEEWSRAVGLPAEQGATIAERSGRNGVDFPWGTDFPPKQAAGNHGDETFHETFPTSSERWLQDYTDGFVTTSPVGSFPANDFGLYDMGGNVWQWCEDWFDASQKSRVARGSTWHISRRSFLLSSERHHSPPLTRDALHGFRCVLELEPAATKEQSVQPGGTKVP